MTCVVDAVANKSSNRKLWTFNSGREAATCKGMHRTSRKPGGLGGHTHTGRRYSAVDGEQYVGEDIYE